jgi:hypothetical protein
MRFADALSGAQANGGLLALLAGPEFMAEKQPSEQTVCTPLLHK